LDISTDLVKKLRDLSGAGVMDCRNTLVSCEGDIDRALAALKEKGFITAQKKAGRETSQGLVEAYIHTGGRIGAMIEVNCETDFVARTDEFHKLAHCLAMQVAAMNPQYISEADVRPGENVDPAQACLLLQPYIKDPALTIKDLIVETIARTGENIRVSRFARFELGG